jgi:anti-anti-sigma factor
MHIDYHGDDHGLQARFSGRSGFGDYKQIEQLCQAIAESGGRWRQVTIDLSGVEFMDSAGLGLLLLLRDQCERYQATVRVKNPQGQVLKMLEVSRLGELFGLPATPRGSLA